MADAPLTVIVPSLPGREDLLGRALASVWEQTVTPAAVLVRVSPPKPYGLGPQHIAQQRTALLRAVRTRWVATLDDDDWWEPWHVETALPFFDDADMIYTWPQEGVLAERINVNGWTTDQIVARLARGNFIPSGAFIRTKLLEIVGGWDSTTYDARTKRYPSGCEWEDHQLWLSLAAARARFHCVPVETWHYDLEGSHEHAYYATRDR